MLHVVTLYVLSEQAFPAFITAVRTGAWHMLARQLQPNLIATDVLQRQGSLYLMCIDFWTSAEAYAAARRSPSLATLNRFRDNLTLYSWNLGEYTHPPHF